MSTIAVVRSQYLMQQEGQGESTAYKHSNHKKDVDAVVQALSALQVPYILLNESELSRTALLAREGIGVIVVPGMRVCAEGGFQRLINLAEQGWIVFAAIDSLYYDRLETGQTERAIERRIRELFQLPGDSCVRSRRLTKGVIQFDRTRFDWLTKGMTSRIDYSGRYRWMLALSGQSESLAFHGNILAEEPADREGVIDESLRGKAVPAFLIREYTTGGMFIYACFSPPVVENSKQIWRNLSEFPSESKSRWTQVRMLKTLVIVLACAVGFLLARELMGDSWRAYIGGIVSGSLTGLIGNWLTDRLNRWIKR